MIKFTEEELEWIVREPLNWHIKDGCPEDIRETLERKLKLLYEEDGIQTKRRNG